MTEDAKPSNWINARAPDLDPWREHDACGVGFVARTSGEPSHEVMHLALEALRRVAHRGAAATDSSGDGAGVLTQIPAALFTREAARSGLALEPGVPFAVGSLFLPPEPGPRARVTAIIADVLHGDGMAILGWRDVPVRPDVLGAGARATCPAIQQVFVAPPADRGRGDEAAWERALYLARKTIEHRVADGGAELQPFFVCSLSARTIVYKALLTGTQLGAFYPDLEAPDFATALAVFHQRYSTNTTSSWPLVQPFHLLAHNGEINTLWGNRNAMRAREPALASALWGESVDRLKPVIWAAGSDSASLDNALELLVRSGRDPVHALMMLVPQAHEGAVEMEPALRGFYEFHECLVEPWDGPAALAFSDGVLVGSALDRNGLRPCRYKITRDGLVVAGSEVGLVDLDPATVIESGRLGPGELLVVDTRRKAVLHDAEAKREIARRRPYARWAARSIRPLRPTKPAAQGEPLRGPDRRARQLAFGWSFEDLRYVLEPMGRGGLDAVWSMGDDTPIPPLARVPPSLYTYLRQRFAQVTNPPIDPLRETLVMSLRMHLGRRGSPLADRPAGLRLVRNEHPVLLADEMAALIGIAGAQAATLDATWPAAGGPGGLSTALDGLCRSAASATRQGARILVVSDRAADGERAPLPMVLAVGAVHQYLLRKGLRTRLGLVAETGDAFDVHHFAALIGYGAEAVYPWLALESVRTQVDGEGEEAAARFRTAAEKGLLKILSKMGISTLSSYCGGQIFEALGLGAEVIDRCFTGTVSPLGGIGFAEIAEDVLALQRAAYPQGPATARAESEGAEEEGGEGEGEQEGAGEGAGERLPDHGRVRYRRDGEDHGWSPPLVRAMQQAVAADTPEAYDGFRARVAARAPASPRDLLRLRGGPPLPLDQVEPAEAIRRRFISTAMSLGALSPEAHRTLAIGMNRMGARSNSGEGGEDPDTYAPLDNGDRADNRIKQVASGRFGVTTHYLMRADELEIKIAQGSKPGEGGQLPGHKVTALIARLRHSVPGVPLISPPPHHDIYSIEDLAQLIYDLKQINPDAKVCVKLVARSGIGTVAAGVAKAKADVILISGHSGGTGASPQSSIKHAGVPWEMGLSEVHQVLVLNRLRHRIRLRVDGGIKTGRDVVIAAILGAEEYGLGTASLVAMGCILVRQCHSNTCPVGICTQDAKLREKFTGTPEKVVNLFSFVAEEVRETLASLGAKSLNEVIGRTDLLAQVNRGSRHLDDLDLNPILAQADPGEYPRYCTLEGRNEVPDTLDAQMIKDAKALFEVGEKMQLTYSIRNTHRAIGTRLSSLITRRFGMTGLQPGHITARLRGSAGQSLGAFAVQGLKIEVFGDANDYVGKGLSGGTIVVRPMTSSPLIAHQNTIIGNTVLYGATAGRLFAAGQAGERFAVRNSGASVVVEGCGSNGCEYMTGGTAVVLGPVGDNFAAGMTGGMAFVYDPEGEFPARVNGETVVWQRLAAPYWEGQLRDLVEEHARETQSRFAQQLLVDWDREVRHFWQVVPKEMLSRLSQPLTLEAQRAEAGDD